MSIRKIIIAIILLLVAVIIVLGVVGCMRYLRISKICTLIENGNTEKTIQYIENTPNVNCYTAPVWMRGALNRIFEQDIQLPLVVACKAGDLDVVIALLKQGADPNKYLKGNWSPIEAAIIGRKGTRLDIIKTLVANGAETNLFGGQNSALFEELLLLMHSDVLTEEAQKLHSEVIDFLLKNGASPVEKDGSTLMHYLSYAGSLNMLNAFYSEYCHFINTQNDQGQTPLMWAARGGETSVVEYLIENGADIYASDLDGRTAYDYAVEEGYSEIAAQLKKTGSKDR